MTTARSSGLNAPTVAVRVVALAAVARAAAPPGGAEPESDDAGRRTETV